MPKVYVERKKEVEALVFDGKNTKEVLDHVGRQAEVVEGVTEERWTAEKGIRVDYLGGSMFVPENYVVVCELTNNNQRQCHSVPKDHFDQKFEEKK